jgi:HSP20 family protein
MKLTQWHPFSDLAGMSDRLNRFIRHSQLGGSNGEETMTFFPNWHPSIDVSETAEAFHIEADLPEVTRENLHIALKDRVLSIQGERKAKGEEPGRKNHRVERPYGRFSRSFTLPDVVDDTKVQSEWQDGVLHVHLPKIGTGSPKNHGATPV